jgi:SAM-dependent methyltransferase
VTSRCLTALVALLALSSPASGGEAPAGHGHGSPRGHDATTTHRFDDVDRWVKVFDDPARDAWQRPADVVRLLQLSPGDVVADLGAGTGYFEPYLSRAVGETGAVLAVDIEPSLVAHLRDRAEKEGTRNVIPILASADNPRLPPAAVDLILIVDTYHHVSDRLRYLGDLRSRLAPGGRIAIVDWTDADRPVGPPKEHALPKAFMVDEMRQAGWTLAADHDVLPYQLFLVFR